MIEVKIGDKIEVELIHLEKKPVWRKATVDHVNDYQIVYQLEDGKRGAVAREGSAQGWRLINVPPLADDNITRVVKED